MTKSLLHASFNCAAVILRVSTRVLRYSTLKVMLLFNVMSNPAKGEKASLMDTELMSYMLLGMMALSVVFCMNPKSPMYSIQLLYVL